MKPARFRFAVLLLVLFLSALPSVSTAADPVTFPAGSLIVPMDTTYQDYGMLKAFGLVYRLLLNHVRVHWVILPMKNKGDADFVTSAVDVRTNAVITNHGYRGGPFVVHASDAAVALPLITAWQASNTTTVHRSTAPFTGYVAKTMAVAPRFAIFADGNEGIAFSYLNAAGIPDSSGAAWSTSSPDFLQPAEVAGSLTNPHDGALFDANGTPQFCQLMSMHWDVKAAQQALADAVVAEVRSFLGFRTHFFAECKAVNTFENNVNGRFLTRNGFIISGDPAPVAFLNQWYPFAQIDGPFATVGGSERSYSLPAGETYKDADVVMITKSGTTPLVGVSDLWMTGYLDGACSINPVGGGDVCASGVGKVSYLGGHAYTTTLPISSNPTTQGTRLFLNSLFEADCVLEENQPVVSVTKSAPAFVTENVVTFSIAWANNGESVAYNALLQDPLPAGTTFVSATGGGTLSGGVVRWNLGNLAAHSSGTVTLTVQLGAPGTYANRAELQYYSGTTPLVAQSNLVSVHYALDSDGDGCSDEVEAAMGTNPSNPDTDGDGVWDCEDTCPLQVNPLQDLSTDVEHCGDCTTVCVLPHATPACMLGECVISVCLPPWADCNGIAADGCEANLHADVDHCGACGEICAPFQSTPACVDGTCTIAACRPPWGDCNGAVSDGCETDLTSSLEHCGGCGSLCAPPHADGVCIDGNCAIALCDFGYADCDGLAANGCEANLLEDEAHCGGCGASCSPANAQGLCVLGVCTVGACLSGMGDCNGLAADGCETDLAASLEHCGGCGSSCVLPHASSHCDLGNCRLDSCALGFMDCNGIVADGCEADLTASLEHCGGCGRVCNPAHAQGVCVDGVCAISSCSSTFADCNGLAPDGCEADLAASLAHCGACGSSCAPENGQGACVDGVCELLACDAGFADCAGTGEGCGTDLRSDLAHCGVCGNDCALHAGAYSEAAACTAGICVYRCLPGRSDLDGDLQSGDAGNGCESFCVPSGSDDNCNGVDDDCNGIPDDAYIPSACGTGACQAFSVCEGGQESCTPLPAGVESGAAVCSDGVDNDCDGRVDAADPDCSGAECILDADCDDADACTLDACGPDGRCSHSPIEECAPDASVPDAEPDADGSDSPRSRAKSGCHCSAASSGGHFPQGAFFLLVLAPLALLRLRIQKRR